jgi:RimJ/RimL family protein N-acetyltransferase
MGQEYVGIRPWSTGDLPLLLRLLGDPVMTKYLGGPEAPEKIRERHERYCRLNNSDVQRLFASEVGPERLLAGWVGYWEKEWKGRAVWEVGWSVLPEFQGQGVATRATALLIERARAEKKRQYMDAFPSVDNSPSNAICRKLGFRLLEEADFEYPKGHFMRCNDWQLDLSGISPKPNDPPRRSGS